MYCIKCGTKLEGSPQFCHHCGQPLAQASRPVVPQPPGASLPVAAMPTATRRAQRKALPKWLTIVLVGFLILVLACGVTATSVYLLLGLHRTNQAAKIVPAETTVFVSLSPTLLHLPQLRYAGNLTKAGAVFFALPQALGMGDVVQEGALLDLDVDPNKDILPWIGREVSLAVVGGDRGEAPRLILAVATRNKRASDAFLEEIQSEMEDRGVEFDEMTYRGTRIIEIVTSGSEPWAYATFQHLVVIATDVDTLRDSIDAATQGGKRVLYRQASFKKTLDELPASRLGYIYLDWSELPEDIWDELEVLGELPIASFQAIKDISIAFGLRKDGLCFDHIIHYDTSALSSIQKQALRQSANPHKLIDIAPADVLAYVSGQKLFLTANALQEGLGEDIVEEIERETGVHLVDDVLSEMPGEYAWVLVSDRAGLLGEDVPVGLLLFIEIEDRTQIEQSLEDLADALAEDGYLDFYQDEVNRVPVWFLGDEEADVAVGYGFVKDYLFIGTSKNVIELATDTGGSALADSKRFQTAVKPLPGGSSGYVYVDVQQSVEVIYRTLDDYDRDEFDENIRPYIESLLAISLATEPMDNNGVLGGALFVYTEAE